MAEAKLWSISEMRLPTAEGKCRPTGAGNIQESKGCACVWLWSPPG